MICPECKSIDLNLNGPRQGKQRYCCNSCGLGFSINLKNLVGPAMTGYEPIEPGDVPVFEFDQPVNIHGITDVHLGAQEHDPAKFAEAIEEIKNDSSAYWFGNGDLIECIPPGYKILQRGQSMEPDEQILAFCEAVQPIAEKCLFLRGGNHDYNRSIRMLGADVVKIMASQLGVNYCELPGYSKFIVGGTEWKMASGHGFSGAKNADLELGYMREVYTEADIFYLGHNHQLYAKPMDSIRIVDNKEELHRQWYIRGGSFIRYAAYARLRFYRLVRTGWVTMELTPERIACRVN